MIKYIGLVIIACLFLSFGFPPKEKWIKLFNGRDIENWTVKIFHHEVGDNYANTFRVEEGLNKVRYDKYENFNNRYGHLFYNKPFSFFKLRFDYRFTGIWRKDAPSYTQINSGICTIPRIPKRF